MTFRVNPTQFDASFYLANTEAARQSLAAFEFPNALAHFLAVGQFQQTSAASGSQAFRPNAVFDPQYYLATNPDVAAVTTGSNALFDSGFEHFQQFGAAEGRAPNAGLAAFDSARYVAANFDLTPTVLANLFPSSTNPALSHYLVFGRAEGRTAFNSTGTAIDNIPAGSPIATDGNPGAGNDVVTLDVDTNGGASLLTAKVGVVTDGGTGIDVLRLTGDADIRIDITSKASQITGLDLDGSGSNKNGVFGVANDGRENNLSQNNILTVKNYEIVDAYARNPFAVGDTSVNFGGNIAFDGTGFGGDGKNTDGNIVLGGVGSDTIQGGIGNDFIAGGGGGAADNIFAGRNADFIFVELSLLTTTADGNQSNIDGGKTFDSNANQDTDWVLLEASDDDEPVTVGLNESAPGGGTNSISTRAGQVANVVEVENLDASGNLYGFLDSVKVELGNRRIDTREEGFTAARSSTASANYAQGSTAQLVVNGSDVANTVIGGYDNDVIGGVGGNDLLFGGNLKFLVQQANNPNLLSATGALDFDNTRNNVADDGRDTLDGGIGDDGIVVELDGGRINGGFTDKNGDGKLDAGEATGSDTGFLTNFTVGRLNGVTGSNEDTKAATNEAAALDALTTDSVVRIDLGNQDTSIDFTTTGAAFTNYGGSNLNGTADQTKYEAGVTAVDIDGLENIIATGLGTLDYDADGGNAGDLAGFGAKYQANFAGFSGALDLRGSTADNILYANLGNDDIEGRQGNDKLSGGRGDDDFIFWNGDGRDLIWRQNDKNADGIFDGTFGRDFRADPFAAAAVVPTTIDFSFTNLAVLDDVGTLTFLRAGTLVSLNVGATNLTTVASLVTAINAAGLPAGVTVAALNANTIRFTDANGLQAAAPGVTSVSGAALPVTLGPIVQGSTTTPGQRRRPHRLRELREPVHQRPGSGQQGQPGHLRYEVRGQLR